MLFCSNRFSDKAFIVHTFSKEKKRRINQRRVTTLLESFSRRIPEWFFDGWTFFNESFSFRNSQWMWRWKTKCEFISKIHFNNSFHLHVYECETFVHMNDFAESGCNFVSVFSHRGLIEFQEFFIRKFWYFSMDEHNAICLVGFWFLERKMTPFSYCDL